MSSLRALLFFDFSRCRWFLVAFWLYCLLQALAGLYYLRSGDLFGLQEDAPAIFAYVLMLVIIGLIFSPGQPGLRQSFFRARPIASRQVLWARWSFAVLVLLFPQFLSLLVPLLFVEPGLGGISAFAVYYWGIHLAGLALLGTLAAVSRKKSTYLLLAGFSLALITAVAEFSHRFSWRESNQIYVTSPEASRLLWEFSLTMVGLAVFLWLLFVVYRGRVSRKVMTLGCVSALLLAMAWQPISFRVDDLALRHPIPAGIFNEEDLSFSAGRVSHLADYWTQETRSSGNPNVRSQLEPPYWDSNEEAYWFRFGKFEIEGLDPRLVYSAHLLTARWVAPGGEVIDYDRPAGTFMIGEPVSLLIAPQPTTAELNALLGTPQEKDLQFLRESKGGDSILLFGAWTSDYELFKTTPGRLEMRVRVDLFTHAIDRLPLNPLEPSPRKLTDHRLMDFEVLGNELVVQVQKCRAAKRWSSPIEEGWSDWMLYSPETGRRGLQMGGGGSNTTTLTGFQLMKSRLRFRFENGYPRDLPDFSDPEALEMIHIQAHYLGSTEVDVVVEDFSLVTEKSIEWTER